MNGLQIVGSMFMRPEPETFHMLRENGQPAFNFIHFLDPVVIVLAGVDIYTDPNACIIYAPETRQEYYALPGGFRNNFVTFSTDDIFFISHFELPQDQVFYIRDSQAIMPIVENIARDFIDYLIEHKAAKKNSLTSNTENLFKTLSKQILIDNPRDKRNQQVKQRFIELRRMATRSPKDWTVEKMADKVYLTRGHFTAMYKSFFQIAPGNDLINMSIQFGKRALLNTDDLISSIARDCGYKSSEHFIRIFKRREGITPGQYRKRHRPQT